MDKIRINTLPGCEDVLDIYSVDKEGNVYSEHLNTFMKPRVKENGYLQVAFKLNGIRKWKKMHVHRLVALAFIENPNNYRVVNHKDETKDNNCIENLEWCTHLYNVNYGTCIERAKQSSNKNPLKVYNLFGELVEEGLSMCDTSKKYLGYKDTTIIDGYFKGYLFSDKYLDAEQLDLILDKCRKKPVVMEDIETGGKFLFNDMKTASLLFDGKVNITDAINKKRTVRKKFKFYHHKISRKDSPTLYEEGSIRIEG